MIYGSSMNNNKIKTKTRLYNKYELWFLNSSIEEIMMLLKVLYKELIA